MLFLTSNWLIITLLIAAVQNNLHCFHIPNLLAHHTLGKGSSSYFTMKIDDIPQATICMIFLKLKKKKKEIHRIIPIAISWLQLMFLDTYKFYCCCFNFFSSPTLSSFFLLSCLCFPLPRVLVTLFAICLSCTPFKIQLKCHLLLESFPKLF